MYRNYLCTDPLYDMLFVDLRYASVRSNVNPYPYGVSASHIVISVSICTVDTPTKHSRFSDLHHGETTSKDISVMFSVKVIALTLCR